MRAFEKRRCLECGTLLRKVPGSERTKGNRTWFTLRCTWCGHEEMDWHERRTGRKEG